MKHYELMEKPFTSDEVKKPKKKEKKD